ncbi:3'-5' exonuclease [Motiliproteus sp.]|uniref:3'-5' exonuclease n=1 Tax=Motiliproteus sp. TaxID=1898955 RepID=UPI003BAC41B8
MFYLKPDHLDSDFRPDQAVQNWAAEFQRLAQQARDPRLQSYYRAGMVAADTPISQAPLVAMDFETTGLDPEHDGIVSIGLVPLSLARIRCADAREWILRPRAPLSSSSVVIHGITHSEVADADDLSSIIAPLLEALTGRILVVHCSEIERKFLDAALRLRIGEGIRFPVIDTLELEARLHRPLSIWSQLFKRQQVSIALAESRSRYRLPFYRPHHALTDALACAELLQAQVADRFTPETPVSELWS